VRLFAYGALMWERDALATAEAVPARLPGYARAFCLWDPVMRGTPERPALTTGLVPGEACSGVVFTLPKNAEPHDALWPAWEQEMRPGFYRAEWLEVRPLPDGPACRAIGFVADEAHPLFVGGASVEAQAEVIAGAKGKLGTAGEYLRKLVGALQQAGLRDEGIERLAAMVGVEPGAIASASAGPHPCQPS